MTELTVSEDKFFSLFNGESLRKAYYNIDPSQHQLSEVEVVACMKPTKTDWKIRIRLWDLVNKALDVTNEYNKIYMVDIVEDITTKDVLYTKLKSREYFAKFLMTPIEKYTDEVNTMLAITRDKMWRLINNLEPVKKDGSVDRVHANLLIKVHTQLVDRKMGAVKQLIDMKKVQLNVNATADFSDDIELLDSKIQELKPGVEIVKQHGLFEVTESKE